MNLKTRQKTWYFTQRDVQMTSKHEEGTTSLVVGKVTSDI